MKARVAVVSIPGTNCEAESVRALERVGLAAEIQPWSRSGETLREFQAYLLPGGFAYQDRVRAGALAAKDPRVEVLAEEAERGKPVLGICNGAQVLVEAGLVSPAGQVDLALARNRMSGRSGYYTRWVYLRVEDTPCVFTRALEPGSVVPMPVAHGEGRFASRVPSRLAALLEDRQVPFRYADADGRPAEAFPLNPNGSPYAIAAVCNPRGNVLALMPHPERAQDLGALGRGIGGPWGDRYDAWAASHAPDLEAPGPGLALFEGLRQYLERA
jgi:phosphoribosylformylglycinamidine synthase I